MGSLYSVTKPCRPHNSSNYPSVVREVKRYFPTTSNAHPKILWHNVKEERKVFMFVFRRLLIYQATFHLLKGAESTRWLLDTRPRGLTNGATVRRESWVRLLTFIQKSVNMLSELYYYIQYVQALGHFSFCFLLGSVYGSFFCCQGLV